MSQRLYIGGPRYREDSRWCSNTAVTVTPSIWLVEKFDGLYLPASLEFLRIDSEACFHPISVSGSDHHHVRTLEHRVLAVAVSLIVATLPADKNGQSQCCGGFLRPTKDFLEHLPGQDRCGCIVCRLGFERAFREGLLKQLTHAEMVYYLYLCLLVRLRIITPEEAVRAMLEAMQNWYSCHNCRRLLDICTIENGWPFDCHLIPCYTDVACECKVQKTKHALLRNAAKEATKGALDTTVGFEPADAWPRQSFEQPFGTFAPMSEVNEAIGCDEDDVLPSGYDSDSGDSVDGEELCIENMPGCGCDGHKRFPNLLPTKQPVKPVAAIRAHSKSEKPMGGGKCLKMDKGALDKESDVEAQVLLEYIAMSRDEVNGLSRTLQSAAIRVRQHHEQALQQQLEYDRQMSDWRRNGENIPSLAQELADRCPAIHDGSRWQNSLTTWQSEVKNFLDEEATMRWGTNTNPEAGRAAAEVVLNEALRCRESVSDYGLSLGEICWQTPHFISRRSGVESHA